MAKLQSDRYERGYFHKIWIERDWLGENSRSGTLSLKFISCQNPYQQQNLKISSTFQGHKTPHGQNFWNLTFFIWKDNVIYISPEQKSTWGHIIFIHKSYNEFVDEVRFISLKTEQKWNLTFFWKLYLTFFFVITFHTFLLWISSGQR